MQNTSVTPAELTDFARRDSGIAHTPRVNQQQLETLLNPETESSQLTPVTKQEKPPRTPTPYPRSRYDIYPSPARSERVRAGAEFEHRGSCPNSQDNPAKTKGWTDEHANGLNPAAQSALPRTHALNLHPKQSTVSLHPGFNPNLFIRDSPLYRGPAELRYLTRTTTHTSANPSPIPIQNINERENGHASGSSSTLVSPAQRDVQDQSSLFPACPTVASPLNQPAELSDGSFYNLPEYTGYTPSPEPRRASGVAAESFETGIGTEIEDDGDDDDTRGMEERTEVRTVEVGESGDVGGEKGRGKGSGRWSFLGRIVNRVGVGDAGGGKVDAEGGSGDAVEGRKKGGMLRRLRSRILQNGFLRRVGGVFGRLSED